MSARSLSSSEVDGINHLVRYACETYGDHGPIISGVVHDHFPDHVKDRLRFLGRASNEISDAQRLHAFLSRTRSPSFR